jgi:hypothetical protein
LAQRMVAGRGVEEEAELGSADEQVLAGAEIWTKVTRGSDGRSVSLSGRRAEGARRWKIG